MGACMAMLLKRRNKLRLMRLQDLEETEHFRRWLQEKVAKIVQCGEACPCNQ
jgi:hypothetical protein